MTITTENLGKRYNREWIFKDVKLKFDSGNTYAITGPNGSGKSTLLKVLWGQLPPSEGTVNYSKGGINIPLTEVYKYLTIATPYMDLIEEFTLSEMVAFHFRFKKPVAQVSVDQIPEKMGLHHARAKFISNFSSGMKQRLKLGLSFFSDTDVLFFDEPATNLDSQAMDWYHRLLKGEHSKLIFIASNQAAEYPENSTIINLMAYKSRLQTEPGTY